MRSRTTARFRKALADLPEPVREQAREACRRFLRDPWHPGLRFKQVHSTLPIYSARVLYCAGLGRTSAMVSNIGGIVRHRSLWALLVWGMMALPGCSLFEPDCLEVEGGYDRGDPAYVIDLRPQVPIRSTAEQLAKKHGFVVSKIRDAEYLSSKGFTVDALPEAAFHGLRCEAVVQRIWHNGRVAPH